MAREINLAIKSLTNPKTKNLDHNSPIYRNTMYHKTALLLFSLLIIHHHSHTGQYSNHNKGRIQLPSKKILSEKLSAVRIIPDPDTERSLIAIANSIMRPIDIIVLFDAMVSKHYYGYYYPSCYHKFITKEFLLSGRRLTKQEEAKIHLKTREYIRPITKNLLKAIFPKNPELLAWNLNDQGCIVITGQCPNHNQGLLTQLIQLPDYPTLLKNIKNHPSLSHITCQTLLIKQLANRFIQLKDIVLTVHTVVVNHYIQYNKKALLEYQEILRYRSCLLQQLSPNSYQICPTATLLGKLAANATLLERDEINITIRTMVNILLADKPDVLSALKINGFL